MKYFNGLNMGEGIVGGPTIGMSTTAIYSCMGIAIVNKARQIGGLYHYPAKTITQANVSGTLGQMINDVQPDEIYLTPATPMMGVGSEKSDIAAVAAFLKQMAAIEVTIAPPRAEDKPYVSAQLTWVNGAPVYNVHPDGAEDAGPGKDMRKTMNTARRQVEADIWYYGGDGETDGVLDQGLAAPPKGCCTIL